MIKAVFFDVANTLLYKPNLFVNLQDTFSNHGQIIPIDIIRKSHQKLTECIDFPNKTDKKFYQTFNTELCGSLGIESSDILLEDIYKACSGLSWTKFSDIEILNELSLPIGVGSNWDSTLRQKLEILVSTAFQWILVSEELGIKKPNPEFFQKMIDISGYQANEIMFVGDSLKLDIIPSKPLGIRAVLIDRTDFYQNYEGEKLKSMDQLIDLL